MYGAVTGKKGWSNMADMKIGIVGAAGRMGGTVIRQVTMTDGCVVAAASEIPGSEAIGKDAGEVAGCGALGALLSLGLSPSRSRARMAPRLIRSRNPMAAPTPWSRWMSCLKARPEPYASTMSRTSPAWGIRGHR